MGTQLHKTRHLLLIMFMLLLTAGFTTRSYSQCSVATDKEDYWPGETVIITGTGWLPGEAVQLTLVHLDPIPTHDHESWFTWADSAGNIYDTWFVEEQELGTSFRLEALGVESDCYAECFFTDGRIEFIAATTSGNLIGVLVTYSALASGPANSYFTGITSPNPNLSNQANVYFRFQTPVTINSINYTLTGTPISSNNTTVYNITGGLFDFYTSANGNKSITATYTPCNGSDVIDPNLVGIPGDISLLCTDIIPDPPNVTATDNCDPNPLIEYTQEVIDDCGSIIRTWTATDDAGNEIIDSQTITIIDVTAPVITAPLPLTLTCNQANDYTAQIEAWIATASVSDDCDQEITIVDNFTGYTQSCG
ncbi:MAG: hypothetical protein ACM3ME_00715, partial [Chloroflexota bacterium]